MYGLNCFHQQKQQNEWEITLGKGLSNRDLILILKYPFLLWTTSNRVCTSNTLQSAQSFTAVQNDAILF